MKVVLKKKPKNPIIIEGFPGFGLVGTIATEFLIDHLETEKIGKIWVEELPAMVAIHEGEVVEPIGIFYNGKYNIVIIHAISVTAGIEWKLTDAIVDIAKQVQAKEIISLEGIGSTAPAAETKTFHYTSNEKKSDKLKAAGSEALKEGIIMGTTGILMLKAEKKVPVSCIFAETRSELPDSKAAAKVIEILDKYIGLKVDYKPLIKQAEKFEEKLKDLLMKSTKVAEEQKKKKLSYVG
ncbi:PAC2 family protein [Candidatus Woesearchaeota archaeon]|nr:PAC2 family protein [Candidatus Woesearchaeota archaeon]